MTTNSVANTLQKLETFKDAEYGNFDVSDKFYCILASKGIRKAGSLYVTYKVEYKGDVEEENVTYVDTMEQILQGLGIPYSKRFVLFDDDPKDVKQYCVCFYYGQEHERFKQLIHSSKRSDQREIAVLRAYPESAINAFFRNMCLRRSSWPQQIRQNPVQSFLCFMLSQVHWEEEMQILEKQVKLASEDAPWLWEQGLKVHKRRMRR